MTNYIRYGLLAILTILLVSSSAASLERLTLDWNDWNEFSDTIDNCESDNCVENDQMETISPNYLEAKLDTGNTGYCGTAGLQKDIVVPDGENTGLAISLDKAKLDNWGGRVGVKANDEWLITFNSEGGQSKTYNPGGTLVGDEAIYYADIGEYAGEEVTFKVATEDTSREWCNMGDHEQSLNVNALFIVSDIQNGEFTSDEDWRKTAVNQVNCENQYNCEDDQMQPLDTNEISGGQLVLNTGMGSSDGHCGTYGRQQWVYVPKSKDVTLNFEASAKLDEWGGNLGVMFDNDWVFSFDDTRGNGQKNYEMQERTVDVSEYAGEYVVMKVAYQDTSGSYCNQYDHDRKMTVESIGFETSGDQGDQANEAPEVSLSSSRFAGTTVSFNAEATDPDNGQGDMITYWDWDYDGEFDTDTQALEVSQVSHTYEEGMGEVTAAVGVIDGDGGRGTATETVQLGNPSPPDDDDGSGGGEQPSGEVQDIVIQDNGWKTVILGEEVDRSKFSGCNGDEPATAYSSDSDTGYLKFADLSDTGTLPAGKYFIQSTSESKCTVEDVKVSSAPSTGEVEIPDNGWKTVILGEEVDRSKFSGCNGDEPATAYSSDSDTGYLKFADLSDTGTLPAGKYFIQSTSESKCTIDLGGSEDGDTGGDTGGDDSDGSDSEETDYASTEDEWCQTNGNGQALSAFRDDVESGCKPVNDLGYEQPSGGEPYYASEHSEISCTNGDEAYICEE